MHNSENKLTTICNAFTKTLRFTDDSSSSTTTNAIQRLVCVVLIFIGILYAAPIRLRLITSLAPTENTNDRNEKMTKSSTNVGGGDSDSNNNDDTVA